MRPRPPWSPRARKEQSAQTPFCNYSWRTGTAVAASSVMRRIAIPAIALVILAFGCEKRTETQTTTDSTGTVQSQTTTVSATVPTVDTAATAAAAQDAKDAARDAAHATGTAIETAGKEIQKQTEPPKKKKP